MPWSETLLITEEFEGTIINIPIYGTGKKFGDDWLYGGAHEQGWLRPVHVELFPSFAEDFENPNWVPPTWTPATLLTEDFENADWLRPSWSEGSPFDDDFEGIWV